MSMGVRPSRLRTGYLIDKYSDFYIENDGLQRDHAAQEPYVEYEKTPPAKRTPRTSSVTNLSRRRRSSRSKGRKEDAVEQTEEFQSHTRRTRSVSRARKGHNSKNKTQQEKTEGPQVNGMSTPRMRTLQGGKKATPVDTRVETGTAQHEHDQETGRRQPSLKGEYGNLCILLVLYILQGIPMGLAMSVPLMLKEKGFGFSAKGQFSMASWPYGMKLLWAPIVDAVYSPSIGRRKSWVIPVQLLTGIMMIWLGTEIDWQFAPDSRPQVTYLASIFFILYFLVATQDIAVDGWALTMLRPENVGYASTCNSVGQQIGFLTSYALFMAFNSPDFTNRFLRTEANYSNEGLITMGQFMMFWGVVFIVVTTIIGIIKTEKVIKSTDTKSSNYRSPDQTNSEELLSGGCSVPSKGIRIAYARIIQVISLPHVLLLMAVLVTCRFPFASIDGGFDLELMEKGIPKDKIAILGVAIITPLELISTTFVSRFTSGPRPLSVFLYTFPVRIALGFLIVLVLRIADFAEWPQGPPFWFYFVSLLVFGLYRCCANVMFVAQMSFFNRVSDPSIGGTYMTLLNTLSNIGGMWAVPLVLKMMDVIEVHQCELSPENTEYQRLQGLSCEDPSDRRQCTNAGGSCVELRDGFLPMVIFTLSVGCVWWIVMRNKVVSLENTQLENWRVRSFDTLPKWAKCLIEGDKEEEKNNLGSSGNSKQNGGGNFMEA